MDFLTQEDLETGQRLYQPNIHTVWLDNLFTSVKLLQELHRLGIGGAKTIQTTKTKYKELDEKKELKKEQIDQQLTNLKLLYQNQIPWGTLYARLSEDETVIEFA